MAWLRAVARKTAYWAAQPPSTLSAMPRIWLAASLHR
jgi:hypothetical protein